MKKELKARQIVLLSILALVLVGAATFGVIWCLNVFSLTLNVQGQPEITLEYGSSYSKPEASAVYQGTLLLTKGKEIPVSADGQVDTGKIGTYTVTYHTEYRGLTQEQTRLVHIVDTQAPQITLVSDPEKFTFPGQEYAEEGFSAADGYDGDLTSQVTRTVTQEEIIYTVSDSSGNETQVRRTIKYDDPIPPELTLLGEASVTMTAGGEYKEPGYTASDNCDGDLTEKVEVSGAVDTKTPGTYVLTYSVTDSYQNTVSATREVIVKKAPPVNTAPDPIGPADPNRGKGKYIYLTFDDGPGIYTEKLLAVLAKYNVKATFFLVNTGYISLASQIAAQGHAVGIHSVSHVYRTIYASEEAYFNDITTMQSIIEQYTGIKTTLLRFPGGSSNMVSSFNPGIMTRLTKAVEEAGFQYFDWNVSSADAGGASTPNEVYYNVIYGIGNKTHSVVLQHDIKGFSVDAVERIIQWGLANGYTFLPLSPSGPICHHGVNN